MHFSKIDEKKTADNAREVLEGYEDLHNVELRELIALKSPEISDMPKGSIVGNTTESGAIRFIQARKYCTIVKSAIEIIQNDLYKIILTDVYLYGKKSSETMEHLEKISSKYHFEDAQFFRKKKEAQITFAEVCPPIMIPGEDEPRELLAFKK